MKANKAQQYICDVIMSQASCWKNSNDITSPTHLVDIEEECQAQLSNLMGDGQIEDLIDFLADLYWYIRSFNKTE